MEKEFTPRESLALIQSMIEKTRANISDNRFYFLFWGWITFLAFLIQFSLKVLVEYRHHYMVWLVTFPAVLVTILYGRRHNKTARVRTYTGENMSHLWMGVGMSFFLLSFIITFSESGWSSSYPFFILLYGLGTFVSGKMLRFRPFVIGGIINWILAVISVFFSFDYQMLFAAAAILTSYIIPAYLIKPEKPYAHA